MPECRCSVLYQVKKRWQNARASAMQPNVSGKSGRYFSVVGAENSSEPRDLAAESFVARRLGEWGVVPAAG
jgi:hypothetical protein